VRGKTVSVALSREQYEWLKEAIAHWRDLQQTLKANATPFPAGVVCDGATSSSSQAVGQESFGPYLRAIRVNPDN
jgi:hypothetical protein